MRRWRLEVEADPSAARIVRRTFEAWLASMDCGEDDWLDARLALSELVTIAIRETVEPIDVTATLDHRVLVAVEHYPLLADGASHRYERLSLMFDTSAVAVTSETIGVVHRAQITVEC